jgi:hypothetical protein
MYGIILHDNVADFPKPIDPLHYLVDYVSHDHHLATAPLESPGFADAALLCVFGLLEQVRKNILLLRALEVDIASLLFANSCDCSVPEVVTVRKAPESQLLQQYDMGSRQNYLLRRRVRAALILVKGSRI